MAELQQQQHYYSTRKDTPPPSSQTVLVATLIPLGASLLILAGLTLTATIIGLALVTPLFVFFSPVLLPASLVVALAVAGFLTSGAFGITSISSFAWIASYIRRSHLQERLQYAKDRAAEIMGDVAHRATEAGENLVGKVQNVTGQDQAQTDAQSEAESVDVAHTGADSVDPAQNEAQESAKARESGKARKSGKAQEEKKTSS